MAARLTRRHLLGTFGTAALSLTLPELTVACTPEGKLDSDKDVERADAGDAPYEPADREELLGLPSENGLWQLVNQMNDLGPRYTGGRAHTRFIELLASGLESLGLDVKRDTKKFYRWSARKYGLAVTSNGEMVPVTSYYPYSGETSQDGVSARLYYAGSTGKPDYSGAKGKIVIVDCPIRPLSMDRLFHVTTAYPPEAKDLFPKTAVTAVSQFTSAPTLADALAAGAVGAVLVWTNVSEEAANDQYLPFGRPHQGLPALWVANAAGDRLKTLARAGSEVTLTLVANTDADATTDTIWAELRGQMDDELIIVNSHTDGLNAVEENGSVAVLAIATALSQLPLSSRRRSVVFALTAGNLAIGPASVSAFVQDHPELVKKAVAAVTVQHCGCLEWSDDENGNYRATGSPELGITMASTTGAVRVFEEAMEGTKNERMFAVDTAGSVYFGDGAAFFAARIPTISYIPLPSYLCSTPENGHIDKLSSARMMEEVRAFARAIRLIDGMSADALRG
jgi:hypothetical protein